jgi:hypothetical protein
MWYIFQTTLTKLNLNKLNMYTHLLIEICPIVHNLVWFNLMLDYLGLSENGVYRMGPEPDCQKRKRQLTTYRGESLRAKRGGNDYLTNSSTHKPRDTIYKLRPQRLSIPRHESIFHRDLWPWLNSIIFSFNLHTWTLGSSVVATEMMSGQDEAGRSLYLLSESTAPRYVREGRCKVSPPWLLKQKNCTIPGESGESRESSVL